MTRRTILARAKFNLTLDIVGRRADGYHELRSVMVRLALSDRLTVSPDPDLVVTASGKAPSGEGNLVFRSVDLLRRAAGIHQGVRIHIEKRIPVAAGLGGGSADAAAALVAVNELWNVNWPLEQLMALGLQLGADVPFCLLGRPALAEGIGERLTPIGHVTQIPVVVAVPVVTFSGPKTASVYARYQEDAVLVRPDTAAMLQALQEGRPRTAAKLACNVLETAAITLFPNITPLKSAMLEAGAAGVVMAGAGPAVVALCPGGHHVGKVAAAARPHAAIVLITALAGSQSG